MATKTENGGKTMTDRQLRKASRSELLKMLQQCRQENDDLRQQLEQIIMSSPIKFKIIMFSSFCFFKNKY